MLANGMTYAGADAVALGIVDPGVGAARRGIALATAAGPRLVGPDNGLLSFAWRELGGITEAVQIDPGRVNPGRVSAVFHGRDVFAPAAAMVATVTPLARLGSPIDPGILTALETMQAEQGVSS